MQYYLRFELYDGPGRQSSNPVRPDVAIDEPVHFEYGRAIHVGKDEDDPDTWPLYYVANITLAEEIDDPVLPGKNALLIHVFVAKGEQWKDFEKPPLVRELEEEENGED